MEPKIDFRIQGISHAAVEREEDDRQRLIRSPVHGVKKSSKQETHSIADFVDQSSV